MLKRPLRSTIAAVALIVGVAIAPQANAAEPLSAIPDSAAIVVRFQSVDKFLGGINDMMTAIGPPATAASKFVADGIGNEFFELGGASTNSITRHRPMLRSFPSMDNRLQSFGLLAPRTKRTC